MISDNKDPLSLHYWSYCETCDDNIVKCGYCGNNCCNGGYGKLDDGSACPHCPSAYEKQNTECELQDLEYKTVIGDYSNRESLIRPEGNRWKIFEYSIHYWFWVRSKE